MSKYNFIARTVNETLFPSAFFINKNLNAWKKLIVGFSYVLTQDL
jgi:hypothetical protein